MKSKQRIYNPRWLQFHPYDAAASTDMYYTQLANQLLDEIDDIIDNGQFQDLIILNEEARIDIAIVLCCYFEDIISQTNIWKGVSLVFKEKTDRYVPFYKCDDYAEDEINVEDIRFICWHHFQNMYDNQFCFSPLNNTILKIADSAYSIFDKEFEEAPENNKLKDYFKIKFGASEADIEKYLLWIGTESYMSLLNVKIIDRYLEYIADTLREEDREDDIQSACFDYISDFAINNPTEFFGVRAPKLLSHCVTKMSPYYSILKDMGEVKTGYFVFDAIEATFIRLKHIATDKIIELDCSQTKKYPKKLQNTSLIQRLSIINWKANWMLVGGIQSQTISDEIIETVKAEESEIHLFDEAPEKVEVTFNEADQEARLIAVINQLTEENPEMIEEDIWWMAMKDSELEDEYIRKIVKEGKYPSLKFPEDNGKEIFDENIDFILAYLRQLADLNDYLAEDEIEEEE